LDPHGDHQILMSVPAPFTTMPVQMALVSLKHSEQALEICQKAALSPHYTNQSQ